MMKKYNLTKKYKEPKNDKRNMCKEGTNRTRDLEQKKGCMKGTKQNLTNKNKVGYLVLVLYTIPHICHYLQFIVQPLTLYNLLRSQ